jgi:hypothetical protein
MLALIAMIAVGWLLLRLLLPRGPVYIEPPPAPL